MHYFDPNGFIHLERRRRHRRRVILFAVSCIVTMSTIVIILNLALDLAAKR